MWGNVEDPSKPYGARGARQLGAARRAAMGCRTHAAAPPPRAHGAGREFDVSFRQRYENRWDVKQVP